MNSEIKEEMTLDALMSKVLEILPDAILSEESGEIVIATGLRENSPGDVLTPADVIDGDAVSSTHYFTDDGTYGSVDGMEIMDTSAWTSEDWERIEEAGDSARLAEARAISSLRKKQIEKEGAN